MSFGYKQRGVDPSHGNAAKNGTITEHVLVASMALGKPLPRGAEVHHFDGNKRNNANANLVICQSRAYHLLLHARQRIVAMGGDPNTQRICGRCRQLRPTEEFTRKRADSDALRCHCRDCSRAIDRARAPRRKKQEIAA